MSTVTVHNIKTGEVVGCDSEMITDLLTEWFPHPHLEMVSAIAMMEITFDDGVPTYRYDSRLEVEVVT